MTILKSDSPACLSFLLPSGTAAPRRGREPLFVAGATRGLLLALVMGLAATPSLAGDASVSDTYSTVGSTTSRGTAQTLVVRDGFAKTYLRLGSSSLPSGTVGSSVSKATLRIWVESTLREGTFDVVQVVGAWTESTLTSLNEPALGATIATNVAITLDDRQSFVDIEITSAVRGWIDGAPNLGVCLVGANGAHFRLDSKENLKTSHPATLEIVLATSGATGPTGPQGPTGVDGAPGPVGPMGPVGPAGTAGLDGAMGPMGPIGATGPTGQEGPQGPIGPTGADGVRGLMGPQGPIGLTGANGATGPMGPQGLAGLDGAIGPIGPQGPIGLTGADGATGPMGPQGLAGLVGATGTMGPQGPIGLTGANGATGPVGPQGLAGLDGAIGPIGPQGPIGLTGADGATGPQGLAGLDGATGPTGPQGPIGLTGPDGATGPMGPQGLAGLDGAIGPIGPQGLAGLVGATGPTGSQGPIGLTGADGASGPTGAQGPIGLTGADGATGPMGPQGLAGLDGAIGPIGPQGPIGLTGADGATGPMGPQGLAGLDGATGPTGSQGSAGIDGVDGAWTLLGSAVLGANGTDLTVSGLVVKRSLRIEVRVAGYSAASIARLRFNGDAANSYAYSAVNNGSNPTTGISQSGIRISETNSSVAAVFTASITNVAARAKIVILDGSVGPESATVVPTTTDVRGVWANITNQITSITLNSGGALDLLAGTEMRVWGSD